MKKTMIALGLAAVMFLGISYVFAQDQGPVPGHGRGWMHGQEHRGHWDKLNLTPEQRTKFQELRRKFLLIEI